jgi:acyl dehydratase
VRDTVKSAPPEKLMPPLVVSNPQSLRDLVGQEIGVTEWFRVTQERIALFAEATEDRQWIHLDQARAGEESPYGKTIAHGFLTLSLLSHFLKTAAVRGDSRIRARVALLGLKELSDSAEATYGVTIECEQSEKPACVAEWIVRYYS